MFLFVFYAIHDEGFNIFAEFQLLNAKLREIVTDIRHVETLQREEHHHGSLLHMANVKHALVYTLKKNLLEHIGFRCGVAAPCAIYFTDVAEKACFERAVTGNRFLDSLEASENEVHKLLLRINGLRNDSRQLVDNLVALGLDNGIIDVALAAVVGVVSAATFVGGRSDIVHSGILNTFMSE